MIYGYEFSQSAEQLGFQDGDRIVTIGGEKISNISSIASKLLLADENCEIVVIRDEKEHKFALNNDVLNTMRDNGTFEKEQLYVPLIPFVVDSVVSPTASRADLRKGDRIIGLGEESLPYFNHYAERLANLKDTTAMLHVLRGSDTLSLSVPVNGQGQLGVIAANPINIHVEEYGFFESIPAGARLTVNTIKSYWHQLTLIVNPDNGLYKQVGGFISIGNVFPSEWNWYQFWMMTAFLSIILAVMNIIPIPGLDGGHMLFTLWEMITGRQVSEKVLTIAQYIGMALILALLIFANGNDIFKLFN
jgi:regulator of sigma E protease